MIWFSITFYSGNTLESSDKYFWKLEALFRSWNLHDVVDIIWLRLICTEWFQWLTKMLTYSAKKDIRVSLYSFYETSLFFVWIEDDFLQKRSNEIDFTTMIQGLRLCFVFLNLVLTDRNIQARFGLKVIWGSWVVEIWPMTLQFGWK